MGFPLPEYVQFYPTTKCNQHCSFCFNPDNSIIPDMSFEDALLLLDILSENEINNIDIMGGEPFLLPWMAELVKTALSKGMSVNISTNGSLPGIIDRFRGVFHQNFNIGISLEGSTAERHHRMTDSDNFSYAMQSIKKLIDLSLDPLVKTVVNSETAKDIQNILDLLRATGVRRFYLIHMDVLGKREHSEMHPFSYGAFLGFYEKIRRKNPDIEIYRVNASCFEKKSLPHGVRCAGGVRKISILPDGTVFPCNLFHALPDFALGNIFKDSFSDIWAHPALNQFRNHQGNRCGISHCENHASCTGGCPAHGYYHCGNPDMPDIRCLQSQEYPEH